jgi:hypothetical protein
MQIPQTATEALDTSEIHRIAYLCRQKQGRHRDDRGQAGEDTERWGWNPLWDHTAKTTARPEFSLIALICAGYEKTIQKESWRSAEKRHFH